MFDISEDDRILRNIERAWKHVVGHRVRVEIACVLPMSRLHLASRVKRCSRYLAGDCCFLEKYRRHLQELSSYGARFSGMNILLERFSFIKATTVRSAENHCN
jgi:hypothetical protein